MMSFEAIGWVALGLFLYVCCMRILLPICDARAARVAACSPFHNMAGVYGSLLVSGILRDGDTLIYGSWWAAQLKDGETYPKTRLFDGEDWYPIELLCVARPSWYWLVRDALLDMGALSPLQTQTVRIVKKTTLEA